MIINIEQRCFEYIITDAFELPEYRRHPSGQWECLMGTSWEEIDDEDLEAEYQDKLWLQGKT